MMVCLSRYLSVHHNHPLTIILLSQILESKLKLRSGEIITAYIIGACHRYSNFNQRINNICQISLLMVSVLWRDSWLKPLSIYDIETKFCKSCKRILNDKDFVTSCEFCEIGIMHDNCANEHILKKHKAEVRKKIELHRDKPLHDFQ
jgi:hypothetical protein